MKKILVLAAAIALVSSTAFAAGTATLNVTANVTATCSITGGTLGFGALDPVVGGNVPATIDVTVTCTNLTPFTVTNDSAGKTLGNGTSTIPYTLTHAGGGVGTGSAEPFTIDGLITDGTYTNATAGAYTSSVLLTVNL